MQSGLDLLESIIDLHNGDLQPDEWLQHLCGLTGCSASASVSWRHGQPHNFNVRESVEPIGFKSEWVAAADILIDSQTAAAGTILGDGSCASVALDERDLAPLRDSRMLVGCVDAGINCMLLVLRRSPGQPEWDATDRDNFRRLLPILVKGQKLHSKVVDLGHRIDMRNRILDGATRGIVALTPNNEILHTNKMAKDLLHAQDACKNDGGKFVINNRKVFAQFQQKLNEINELPTTELKRFKWNRSFVSQDGVTYQIVMRAHANAIWAMEANHVDRFVALSFHAPGKVALPSAENLQEFYDVSAGQARVLLALLEGHDIKKVADELCLSVHTVRSHLQTVHRKIGVSGQSELMRMLAATLVNYESGAPASDISETQ